MLATQAEDRLYLRAMSESAARPIPGSKSTAVWYPVFSPDSQSIAFWALHDRTVKHIGTNGGTAVTMGRDDELDGRFGPGSIVATGCAEELGDLDSCAVR